MNKFYFYVLSFYHLGIWPLLLRRSNGQMNKFHSCLLKRRSSGTHPVVRTGRSEEEEEKGFIADKQRDGLDDGHIPTPPYTVVYK